MWRLLIMSIIVCLSLLAWPLNVTISATITAGFLLGKLQEARMKELHIGDDHNMKYVE